MKPCAFLFACAALAASPLLAQDAERPQGEIMLEAAPDRAAAERSPFITPGFDPTRRPERRYDNIFERSASEGDRYDFEASGPPGLRKGGNRRLRSLFQPSE